MTDDIRNHAIAWFFDIIKYITDKRNEELYLQEYSVDITLTHPDDVLALFGTNERHLKLIEDHLNVVIHARTERVQILGDDEEAVEEARLTIQALLPLAGS